MSLQKSVIWFGIATLAFSMGCGGGSSEARNGEAGAEKPLIALLPKSKGNAYFLSCKSGAERAAEELGVELIYDGPVSTDPAKQNEIIENWITLEVDAIAAACENREGISTALRKAQEAGIPVITFDSDAEADARSFFVNQATPEGIGYTLMDEAARLLEGSGQFAIITGSLTAANMNAWQQKIEERRSEKYEDIEMVALRPCDDLKDKAQQEATTLLSAYPELDLIMAICSPAVPGAAEAVKQAGKGGAVKVIGLGLPSENRAYVHEGITQSVILWKTEDLGYLTIQAAHRLLKGELDTNIEEISVDGMGTFPVEGDNILLGKPFIFNEGNIDEFDF